MPLPVALYSAAQVRALDAHAIDTVGIPGYTLMKRAGEAALRFLRTRWPTAHRIVIVCGGGNNGGDGYVLARFAQAAGLTVTVCAAVPVDRLTRDAKLACDAFLASGGTLQPFAPALLEQGEVIVDAILGTGFTGPLRPSVRETIEAINSCGRPAFALDVPSGLDADTGLASDTAVHADSTVTFVGLKTGLFLGDGPEYCGTLFFDDLEVASPRGREFAPRLERIVESEIARALPPRRRASHKGDFGRVLIVGGGPGMPGAVRLAGEACLRVGAGLVTTAVDPGNVAAIAAGRPELICHAIHCGADLEKLIEPASVVAVGPGLGRSLWARELLGVCLASSKPLIVDADALNLIAELQPPRHAGWILTPHPGEAARLLGEGSSADVQRARLATLERLVERYGGIVVLKGAGTLVGAQDRTPAICERGNPGMATAGMGDVLTGAVAGILAQCGDPWLAARTGVLVHAMAGDALARGGPRGLLAGDLARELHACVNF